MHDVDVKNVGVYSVHMFDVHTVQKIKMAKKTNTPEGTTTESAVTGITPLVSLDKFQDDVTNVFLHYVRNICWMVDGKTAWAITKAPALDYEYDLTHPDLKAIDMGLTFAHIKDTQFACAMRRMYDYAYFGLIDLGEESLEYESIHTWTVALLVDVAGGAVGNEWDSYGLDIVDCARRCVKVADTANARRVLEGHEEFYHFVSQGKEDNYCDDNLLNVRQVALLSGMEEMSIRAAANPNRANQLKPMKTEHGTRFENTVVKEWLIQKKRYVPITKRWTARDIDLTQSYMSLDEIELGLNTRYNLLGLENGFDQLDAALVAINLEAGAFLERRRIHLYNAFFDDEMAVRSLARILSLPEELLTLRVKEVITTESLRNIERAIKNLATHQK